jgi:hypothetical protein
MEISLAIMAHPSRRVQAETLLDQLKQYAFCDISIIWDELNIEWDTGTRALRYGVGKGQWHVVIQDDALLTPFFYDNIVGAINTVPVRTLISLYTGTARPYGTRVKEAVDKARYATWLRYMLLLWGVGIVIPSDHIEPMLEFVAGRTENYDTRIGIFYQRNRLPVYYTMPSLVNHDDDISSLLGHGVNSAPRVAHRLAKGLVCWNKDVIDI